MTAAIIDLLPELRDRMVQLRDLLIAADHLGTAFITNESAPLFAVMQSALRDARQLTEMVDNLCEEASQ